MNNEPVAWWTGKYEDEGEDFMFPNTRQAHIDHSQSETHTFFPIPLYTQDQLEEARKLGMQQEQALWELAASTQEIMDTHPVKEQEIEKLIGDLRNVAEAQGQKGCWDYDQYMLGLFNGLELALAIFEKREPQYRELPSHPVKELNDGGEPVKNATYWKRQYNLMATQNDNLKSGLYHANEQIKYLESHPVKELALTDEEMISIYEKDWSGIKCGLGRAVEQAILRKASEK